MKIAVIYKKDEQTNIIVEQFKELCNFEVVNLANSDNYDLIISFGGDGTTLKAMPFALSSNKPLISVNTGNLGFLSSYSQLSLSQLIADLNENNVQYLDKVVLECDINGKTFYVLNEFLLERMHGSICETNLFSIEINGIKVNDYYADGVLVATPTGSTAYSFSAGGAILHPELNGLIVNTLYSHNAKCSSFIIPNEYFVKLQVEKSSQPCNLYGDGVLLSEIQINQPILIKKSKKVLKLAKSKEFFSLLNNKLLTNNGGNIHV